MKRGYLEREADVSGVTGTGNVAELVIASDGRVVIFWPTGEGVWPNLEEAMKVHGHGGKTIAVILDDPELEDVSHCEDCHTIVIAGSGGECDKHDFGCPACLNQVTQDGVSSS